MSKELFELASRKKFRFESVKGLLSAEDLWDLPLTSTTGKANLDDIAKALNHLVKSSKEEVSFVNPTTSGTNTSDQARFDIVKYIIGVRVAERDAAKDAAVRAEKKQQILSLIAQKQFEQLGATSLEDLQKLADSL